MTQSFQARKAQSDKIKAVALTLLEQCKDSGLTVGETVRALQYASSTLNNAVNDYPIEPLCNHRSFQIDTQRHENTN